MLSKKNISFHEKRRILEFLSERLRILEIDSKYKFTSINDKRLKEYWNDPDFMELLK